MCGIAGFAGAGSVDDLRRMTQALAHRGPDAGGSAVDPDHAVWLGHRRLVVVDPECGDQPMWSADRSVVVVFNGEIYDAPELRKQLENRGCVFQSHHSDTEILIHGYLEWGSEFVERLNGMWAFALWDRRRRRLLLSRDRFGQKPLYWAQRPGLLAFASELEALAHHTRIERTLCHAALRKFFAYGWVPTPASMLEGVFKLPAGSNLEIELPDGTPRVRHWWEFRLEPEPPGRSLKTLAEELRERLDRAVARRLVADVPLGVFLSGGIDSSTLAHFAAARVEPGALRTFAVSFEEASFDESAYAERVAQHVGSQHRCTSFSMRAAREILSAIADRLDEPLGDASLLPTYLLCGAARREVTVALGGDGGDELFAGYDPFRALRLASLYRRIVPRPVHTAIRLLAARLSTSHSYMSFEFRLKRALRGLAHPPALWNPVWMSPLEPRELTEFLAEPVDAEEVYAEAIAAWESCSSSWTSCAACLTRTSCGAARRSSCCAAPCAVCSRTRFCSARSRDSPCRWANGSREACPPSTAWSPSPTAPPRASCSNACKSTAAVGRIIGSSSTRTGCYRAGWHAASRRRPRSRDRAPTARRPRREWS
jgi:asparagine synthase (glutamine-hydrolysing)